MENQKSSTPRGPGEMGSCVRGGSTMLQKQTPAGTNRAVTRATQKQEE